MNIVITGASRGVGYQTALELSRGTNSKVFALSRDSVGLKKLADQSKSILALRCDITDEESVGKVILDIEREVSGVDILINNAGLLVNKPFEFLKLSDWKSIYAVNVFGVFNVTRMLMPMLRKGTLNSKRNIHAHVVNISSIGGIQGSMKFPGLSAYSSSKGALITLTECLSEELKEEGIRVNCLALGSVETEMFKMAFPGVKAGSEAEETGRWVAEFSRSGYQFFNGKTLPVSTSTP